MARSLFVFELDGPTYTRKQMERRKAAQERKEAEEARLRFEEDCARAEIEAERRNEEYFENRGYWEARAQEDYERAMGIDLYPSWM